MKSKVVTPGILIVDDSMFMRRYLGKIITAQDWQITGEAGDGQQGLELFKSIHEQTDIITLDITMPNMDGIECLEEIIAFKPESRVIMISAMGKEELVEKALEMGAVSYVTKPLDDCEVVLRIREALRDS